MGVSCFPLPDLIHRVLRIHTTFQPTIDQRKPHKNTQYERTEKMDAPRRWTYREDGRTEKMDVPRRWTHRDDEVLVALVSSSHVQCSNIMSTGTLWRYAAFFVFGTCTCATQVILPSKLRFYIEHYQARSNLLGLRHVRFCWWRWCRGLHTASKSLWCLSSRSMLRQITTTLSM